MASYEQQAEVLSRLNAFSNRNKTNFNKRDAVLHEIHRHRENQAASIKFRRGWLESQKRANYKNEYDRLMGAMTAGLVRESSKKYINERMGRLKELASESIHGKQHEIFRPKREEEKTDEEKRKKQGTRHPDAQGNQNAARELMGHMNELQSNLAALNSIAQRSARR